MTPAVTVVVVTYRSAGTIDACLASLTTQAERLVVVDNASPDDTVTRVRKHGVEVIERPNDGFAVAANAGLATVTTDWVLFANPDTEWPVGAVANLIEIASVRPDAGVVSPVLNNPDGSVQPTVEHDLTLGRLLRGLLRIGGAIRPTPPPLDGPPVSVEWVHAAALLMPTDVARAIGGWDERYFLYGEDADLCARVRRAGRTVLVVPSVTVTHVGGASFAQSMTTDDQAALRVDAVGRYLELHQGRWARRLYMAVATVAYAAVGHGAQRRAASKRLR
ncbi:MAG TPA: glycosyltransferase family 2 protein [Acidimicrobiales bacterium]|nr:glycosyltransferase family 2 protein [Acidimicrobiales bacterium]